MSKGKAIKRHSKLYKRLRSVERDLFDVCEDLRRCGEKHDAKYLKVEQEARIGLEAVRASLDALAGWRV